MSLSGQSSESSEREMPTSDSEEEEEENELEEFDDNVGVLTAKPPEGNSNKYSVAAADILEHLDELVESNKISNERAARLRRKYNALLESIENSRTAENALLMKTRELQQQLATDQQILEKADGFPETDSSETSRLRQLLLQHQNELMESEERIANLDHQIELLEEEQKQTQREYDHMPKKEEIQQRIQGLKREIEALADEISQRNFDMEKIQEETQNKELRIDTISNETDQLQQIKGSLQDDLAAATLAPLNIPREVDKLRKTKKEAEISMREHKEMMEDLVKELSRQESQCSELKEQLSVIKDGLHEEERSVDANQVRIDSLTKNLTPAKNHEATLLEERASSELQSKHKENEYRTLYETYVARNKDKGRELKQLKKAELQFHSIQGGLEQQERLYEPLLIKSKDIEEKNQKRKDTLNNIREEVEILNKAHSQQGSLEEVAQRTLDIHVDKERQLRETLKRNQRLLVEASKDVVNMTRRRDNRAKDFYKAQRELKQTDYDLKTKQNQIEDQQKKLRDLEFGMRDFAQAYELVKTERNKTYSQIQTCQQLSAEMREKNKVLQNETEILQTAVDSKCKVLARAQQALITKTQDRDTQYQELTKVKLHQEDTQGELERQREILYKLTQQINGIEQALNRLRHYYEQAVQDRNDMGLQLIERNEEVCVFHEKINVQDSISRKGNLELTEKEEQIRFLHMEVTKLQRELNVCKKTVPEKESIERELQQCQNELLATREDVKRLEEEVADASNPERLRLLPGVDPSCSELRQKLEKLQVQLTECEQKVLEKELLLEQVLRLTDKARKKAESRKETTLQIGCKVNGYQSKLRDGTRKMMALVSELSLQQALAIRLQQELTEREAQLEQAYSRLETGEAPDENSAKEWTRMLQREQQMYLRPDVLLAEEGRELSNGVYTTADPRPNAYIPESDTELPLPKPYGSHAPFKPSQPGANMRHIHKPQPPPIDI